jgi:hypothetical protein
MHTIGHIRPGHPVNDDNNFPCQWHQLHDERVSLAEQEDYLPSADETLPVWLALSIFAVFPLLAIGVVSLVRFIVQHHI